LRVASGRIVYQYEGGLAFEATFDKRSHRIQQAAIFIRYVFYRRTGDSVARVCTAKEQAADLPSHI
jgi:hypothetical protein